MKKNLMKIGSENRKVITILKVYSAINRKIREALGRQKRTTRDENSHREVHMKCCFMCAASVTLQH